MSQYVPSPVYDPQGPVRRQTGGILLLLLVPHRGAEQGGGQGALEGGGEKQLAADRNS